MAHTPGPWVIREPEDDELHEVYAENGGDLICYPVYTANQKANLTIIAEAPELLRELKFAVSVLQDNHIARGVAAALAAIRRAEGRTDDQSDTPTDG